MESQHTCPFQTDSVHGYLAWLLGMVTLTSVHIVALPPLDPSERTHWVQEDVCSSAELISQLSLVEETFIEHLSCVRF